MSGHGRPGRDEVLGAVRARLARARAVEPPAADLPPAAERRGGAAVSGSSDAFLARLRSVGGRGEVVAGPDGAAAALARVLDEVGARRVAWSDAAELAALRERLVGADREHLVTPSRDVLLGCEVGITAAQWGIAETGTVVLDHAVERHREVSLLPAVHVAVLPAARLLATLEDALAALAPGGAPPAAVTFVTGPSRTADIELTLVVGVHGPRALHVLIVDGDRSRRRL